jgi:formylglycine-generating enzyme required for sulfatase activity
VLRGGGWWSDSTSVRCGARDGNLSNLGYTENGFRVLVALPGTSLHPKPKSHKVLPP